MKQEREISLVGDMDMQTIKMEFIPAIIELWAKNQGNTKKVVVLDFKNSIYVQILLVHRNAWNAIFTNNILLISLQHK